jgi:hypothetical protein
MPTNSALLSRTGVNYAGQTIVLAVTDTGKLIDNGQMTVSKMRRCEAAADSTVYSPCPLFILTRRIALDAIPVSPSAGQQLQTCLWRLDIGIYESPSCLSGCLGTKHSCDRVPHFAYFPIVVLRDIGIHQPNAACGLLCRIHLRSLRIRI